MKELFLSIDIWQDGWNGIEQACRIQALTLTSFPDGYHFGHQLLNLSSLGHPYKL